MIDAVPVIRAEKSDDWPAIAELNALAFERENEARLVERLRKRDGFDPDLSMVAVFSGRIVGHIVFSPVVIENATASFQALALAPMAVSPEYQNRGIGSKLVHRGLEICASKGHKIVVVIGHPTFYPRFGFTQARKHGLDSSYPAPDEAFMVLELKSGALKDVSGLVKFPPAFDEA